MEDKRMFGINGTEGKDSGALTPEQQSNLNEFKVRNIWFLWDVLS